MTRISIPNTISDAPEASQELLQNVEASLGSVPNMFRLIGNSAATLEGLLGLQGGLNKGSLKPAIRERIALAIANYNGCDYCNSAHTYLAKNLVKLDDAEIEASRTGRSSDGVINAAVSFALKVAQARGRVSEADIAAVKLAGYSDAEVIEIVGHVALNTFTNYVNEAFATKIDFPVVEAARAA
ncbi:MAG: carboxymuconolactone decarboxylase family protein [Pseudomonadota bacterium]